MFYVLLIYLIKTTKMTNYYDQESLNALIYMVFFKSMMIKKCDLNISENQENIILNDKKLAKTQNKHVVETQTKFSRHMSSEVDKRWRCKSYFFFYLSTN